MGNMKQSLAIWLTIFVPYAVFSEITIKKSKASQVLEKESRILPSFLTESSWIGGTSDDTENSEYLYNIKSWEKVTEEIETISSKFDSIIPESEIDYLEKCVTKCRLKDKSLDFLGESFEENLEKFKQGLVVTRPVPCPECCQKIPKSLVNIAQKWPKVIATCNKSAAPTVKPDEVEIKTETPELNNSEIKIGTNKLKKPAKKTKSLKSQIPQFATAELSQDFDEWIAATKPSTNSIYSPVSIYNILGGIYFGTDKRSETRSELQKNFNFKKNFNSTNYAKKLAKMTESQALESFNSYVFHKSKLRSDYKKDLQNLGFSDLKFKSFIGKEKKLNEIVEKDTD